MSIKIKNGSKEKLSKALELLRGIEVTGTHIVGGEKVRWINIAIHSPEQAKKKEEKEGRQIYDGLIKINSKYGKDNHALNIELIHDPSVPRFNRDEEAIKKLFELIDSGDVSDNGKEVIERWFTRPKSQRPSSGKGGQQ